MSCDAEYKSSFSLRWPAEPNNAKREGAYCTSKYKVNMQNNNNV